ncbi:MAG: restriction endonuclease subunit S [Proteobacteria bacterium]|nr:restriction endonuclease subunit S [Verrucomicrobiota bacterium]NBU10683.1 restriction endonuclease subunit S [Pseudomonadota bacterium]
MKALPKEWGRQKLLEVVTFLDGMRKPIKEADRAGMHGPYPYYGASGVIDYVNAFIFDEELILLGEDGENIVSRNVPLAFRISGKTWVNNHAHVLRPRGFMDIGFLTEYLESLYYDKLNSGTAQPKLNKEICGGILVPVPPLVEQKRIAVVLETAHQCNEDLRKLLEQKVEGKRGLMQQLLTGRKRFKEFKGERWHAFRLGELFTERVEIGRTDLPLVAITGQNGVVPRDSLAKRDSSSEDKSKYLRITPGDIGYNTMRMWQGVAGLSALEGIVSPAYTVCIPSEKIDGRFAAFLFKHLPVVHLFRRHSQGLVDDTLSLKFPNFAQIQVTIPGVEEQRRIAAVLSACDREIELLKKQLDALKEQKRGLMQKLLTGEVRVKVPKEGK